MLSNRSRGCPTPIDLRGAASRRTHPVLQAYWLTDVDEINPLAIEVWYRTTRCFLILDGIEAILLNSIKFCCHSHITLQPKTGCPLKPTGQYLDGRLLGKLGRCWKRCWWNPVVKLVHTGGGWGDPPPPHNVKRFECLEKHYINVINYYYEFGLCLKFIELETSPIYMCIQ